MSMVASSVSLLHALIQQISKGPDQTLIWLCWSSGSVARCRQYTYFRSKNTLAKLPYKGVTASVDFGR
jgi:hypothetical protein